MDNKSDKELLELAAKSAGIIVRWHDNGHYGPTMEIMEDESGGSPWNPLTDDGDALRLAVKLGILHEHEIGYACSVWEGQDPYEATRRAVVIAAAAIGAKA